MKETACSSFTEEQDNNFRCWKETFRLGEGESLSGAKQVRRCWRASDLVKSGQLYSPSARFNSWQKATTTAHYVPGGSNQSKNKRVRELVEWEDEAVILHGNILSLRGLSKRDPRCVGGAFARTARWVQFHGGITLPVLKQTFHHACCAFEKAGKIAGG